MAREVILGLVTCSRAVYRIFSQHNIVSSRIAHVLYHQESSCEHDTPQQCDHYYLKIVFYFEALKKLLDHKELFP